jgi:hypothetical protein
MPIVVRCFSGRDLGTDYSDLDELEPFPQWQFSRVRTNLDEEY